MCRGGALDNILDERFTGRKHFWSACIVDRLNLKKLGENIELYKPEGDFSEEDHPVLKPNSLVFPSILLSDQRLLKAARKVCSPISEFDEELSLLVYSAKIVPKKTKREDYWILEVIDSNNELSKIRCWEDPKR